MDFELWITEKKRKKKGPSGTVGHLEGNRGGEGGGEEAGRSTLQKE